MTGLHPDPAGPLHQRLTLARSLAVQAARRTLRWFKGPIPSAIETTSPSTSLDLHAKPDGSPVTIADQDAELFLREHIARAFPTDAILGEEFSEKTGSSPFRWIIDPIDGTVSFIHGVPLFGTLIALEHNSTPAAGVLALPALDELLFGGPSSGAWHQLGAFSTSPRPPTPARVSSTTSLHAATLATTSLDYFAKARCPDLYPRLQSACSTTRGWSDCYALVLAATGRIDAVVEPLVKPWDIAAIAPIIHAAGGRCTDFQGNPSIHSGNCIVTNGHIHDELQRLVARSL